MSAEFWSKVDQRSEAECWPWTGSTNGGGRGCVYRHGKRVYAYRVAWELRHRQAFPDGLIARHTCDNPICVNPDHIIPGTPLENMRDCIERGRRVDSPRYGTDHHNVSVPPDLVVRAIGEYLNSPTATQAEVAKRYGVSQQTLSGWLIAERSDLSHEPKRKPISLKPCGTHAAYARHLRRGEPACEACLIAEREHCAIYRAKRNAAKKRRVAA